MSDYDSLLADAIMASNPTSYYPMDEATTEGGVHFEDRTATALHLTGATNPELLLRAQASLAPGDPDGKSVYQNKTSPIASRPHNATYEGAALSRVSMLAMYRPDRISNDVYRLISRWQSFALIANQSKVSMNIEGQVDLVSTLPVLAPNCVYMIGAVFNPSAAKREVWVNGVLANSSVPGPSVTVPMGSQKLNIGGFDEFGTFGMAGSVQHVAIWYPTFGNPGETEFRSFYELAASDEAEVAGSAINVMPWSRVAFPANPLRESLILSNDSDTDIYVSLSATAVAGSGLRIGPGEFRKLDAYTGQGSAIHRAGRAGLSFGAKRLTITEW